MTIEELEAAREAAAAHIREVWADIGGLAADEAVSAAQQAPQLDSGFVLGGIRRPSRQIQLEREGAQARARARVKAASQVWEALRRNPDFVAAYAAWTAADAAVRACDKIVVSPAWTEEEKAKFLNSFRWNGKDADGDWADD